MANYHQLSMPYFLGVRISLSIVAAGVTFHFELQSNYPAVTEASGNLPFQLQPDLSIAITVKHYL